jgi:hypothetical protein
MKLKFFFTALLISSFVSAQTKVELSVMLHDGSNMFGSSELKDLSLVSEYGNINIPLKKARGILFGLKADASTESKVKNLINDFKSSTESVRQNAYESIIEIGMSAIPILQNYLDNNLNLIEPEDYSASKAYSALLSSNSGLENYSKDDIVDFDDNYRLGGNVSISKIDLKTEFGQLSIPTSKIKSIEISVIENISGEINLRLNANKHISGNTAGGWLKTGIKLKAGQKISITSNGSIMLASLSNGKYTPEGVKTEYAPPAVSEESSSSAVEDAAMPSVVETGAATDTYNTGDSYPTYGQVVYKIGEDGEAMKAGKKFIGKMNKSGMLYLSIYETVYNNGNSGSYNVKVKVIK